MSNILPESSQNKVEVSLFDIFDFVLGAWKKLAIAAIAGAFIGFFFWFLIVDYTAEVALHNNNKNNDYAFNIISWRTFQRNLPRLAAQVVAKDQASENELPQFKLMRDDLWWKKNVVPYYALSKADITEMVSSNKDIDRAATTILSLTIQSSGTTKQKALEAVEVAAKFLRTGSAYLELRSLIAAYDSNVAAAKAEIDRKITSTEIELEFLNERSKSLEELRKRFPQGAGAYSQVVDAKDSGAKYLPIATQIIAVNNDVNANREALERLKIQLLQIQVKEQFLSQVRPLLQETSDGLTLVNQLLVLNTAQLQKVEPNKLVPLEELQRVRTELLAIQNRFTNGLEASVAPTVHKNGIFKSVISGLATTFFIMLFFLLSKKLLAQYKKLKSASPRCK